MYKLTNKIEKVLRFFCDKDELYLSKETEDGMGIVEKLTLEGKELIGKAELNESILDILFEEENLLFVDSDGKGILYDRKSLSELLTIPLKVTGSRSYADKLVVVQGDISEKEFGIYSKHAKKVLWLDKEQRALETFGDYLFGQKSFEVHRTDITTGKILWWLDLKPIYPTLMDKKGRMNYLGVNADSLIVGIDAVDKLLGVSIADGSIKWDRTTLPGYYKYNTQKEVLQGITVAYECINPSTGEVIDRFVNEDYFDEVGIFSQRNNFAIVGDHLITTDHSKGVIGAFNTVTHRFDWVYKEEGVWFPGSSPIVYSDRYLFVKDFKDTLFIFERE